MSTERVIALGFFDGVHLGHAALLRLAFETGAARGMRPAAMTFDEHPLNRIIRNRVPLLTKPEDRVALIREVSGIEETIVLHFNDAFMHTPWEQFLDSLTEEYGVGHIVCGYDYSCGYRGEGTAEKLGARCLSLGIGFDMVEPVVVNGERVSSSRIRTLVAEGEMEDAAALYGHPHMLTGIVRTGKRLGRTIGAPTINQRFDRDLIVPRHGVYASVVTLPDGRRMHGVTNVGIRPTVEDTSVVNAETCILGFEGDLYGQMIRLELLHFVRPEMKFSGLEELKEQIHADAEWVSLYFGSKTL